MVERLVKGDGMDRRGHEFRYRLASGFCRESDVVLDAACGTGYGREILQRPSWDDCSTVEYRGVDRDLSALEIKYNWERTHYFTEADLDAWVPDFRFDVFVSFETLEHVQYPDHLLSIGAQARQWLIASVPVVPTKHVNEFHLHDFEPGWLEEAMSGYPDWEHYQTVQQPSEASEISVFQRVR
jgi:SAM-dependent methyltransferase